jgi:hypothetical protein
MPENRRNDRGRRGLFARVLERRRLEKAPAPDGGAAGLRDPADAGRHGERIAALESRLSHLESLLEGLQDAVHRDSVRREREIQELEQKTAPARMSRSLAEHDRERGL